MDYPLGIKKTSNYLINYKNRGMTLEDDINKSNQYYIENNIAYIYKKPTPIKKLLKLILKETVKL